MGVREGRGLCVSGECVRALSAARQLFAQI